MKETLKTEKLKREIGVGAFTLTIINGMVGAGIFVIPAIIQQSIERLKKWRIFMS